MKPIYKGYSMDNNYLDDLDIPKKPKDEIEDLLGDIAEVKDKPDDKPYYKKNNYYKNNYNNKNSFNNNYKKKYSNSNVIGKNKINLWNNDRVSPIELQQDKFKHDKKYVTIALANQTYEPGERELAKFKKIFILLKENGYKVRVVCNYVRNIHKLMIETLGKENIYHITPWKSYCRDSKNITMYLPTDFNIRASANYFKGFSKAPASLRYIMASIFTTCFGLYNNEPSDVIIIDDPFYKGDKIDFTKSKDTSNYIMLAKTLGMDIYNISIDEQFADIIKLFKK